ncbi:hypothetical protein [Maribacter sp. 2-571]|uniref:hypothetical protein n=1 Tax=Maribacter sp. 2-571 TaxID=3417569 RepID=UPI003D32FC3A
MENKSIPNKRRAIKKRLFIESFLVLFIIVSPFMFNLHNYLPKDPEATLDIFGITIGRNGFPNIKSHAWFLLGKIIPLYLLAIWFFTCKHWWYHIILIPTTMYAFQIFEVMFFQNEVVDTDNLFWLLPVCMVVIPFVYFVRIKLYDKHVHGIDLEAMEAELNNLRDKQHKEQAAKEAKQASATSQEKPRYRTLSEKIEYGLSTQNIERKLKKIQHGVKNLLHF